MPSLPLTVLPSGVPHWPAQITSEVATAEAGFAREAGTLEGGTRPPTFAVYTLGCKVNAADTNSLARVLAAHGFRMVPFRERADLYVVDTCTVTQEADKKSRKVAARARRNNPDGVVAVTGCAATRDAAQFERAAPGALVLSNARKWELPQLALQALRAQPDWARDYERYRREAGSEPVPSPTRERAVLKIQDGCGHRCAFCIIPRVRGRSTLKSRTAALAEARELVAEGARELVVTGVSLGDWHTDALEAGAKTERSTRTAALCELLREIAELPGLARLRVSSIDVADADEQFLALIANHPQICPHLHLALQSGSRTTLRRMRRRYTPERFLSVARRWRALRPDGGLTTDVIVGFPGETRAEWEESLQLVRDAAFSSVHVFPYSPREGTYAAENLDALGGLVPVAEQNRRVDELLALSADLARNYAQQFVGATLPIMLEGKMHQNGDTLQGEGLTPHYVKVSVRNVPLHARRGDIVLVKMSAWNGELLRGEVIE